MVNLRNSPTSVNPDSTRRGSDHQPQSDRPIRPGGLLERLGRGRNSDHKQADDSRAKDRDDPTIRRPSKKAKAKLQRLRKEEEPPCDLKEVKYVLVPWWIAHRLGGNPAILFSRILYWHRNDAKGKPRLAPDKHGRPTAWCPGYRGIEKQTGLNKQQARRTWQMLLKTHLILPPTTDDDGEATRLRFRLDPEAKKVLRDEGLLEYEKRTWENKSPRLRVWPEHVKVTGGGNPALVLAEIAQWFEPGKNGKPKKGGKTRDGQRWIAKSDKDLARRTGLGVYQVKRAMKALLENKHHFLRAERDWFQRALTRYVTLDRTALIAALEEIQRKEETGEI